MSGGDGTITVKFASMAEGEQALEAGVKNLNSRLTTLEGDLQPLVRSWSGDAQTAYLAQKAKWEEAAKDMSSMLHTIRIALGDAHQNYKGAVKSVQNSWE